MKAICDRQKLLTAFQLAAAVAPSRSPKPILMNVRFDFFNNSATLVATDLDTSIRVAVEGVEIVEPGSAVLPVDRFGAILRENTDEKITVETDENGAKVSGDRSRFKLPVSAVEEFPNVASFEEEKYHIVSARRLKELVRRTVFATDAESSRYSLGGVLLEMEGDTLIGVATDGRRLAKMEIPAESVGGHGNADAMTIAPTRSMQLVDRVLADPEEQIKIAARPNDILIQTSQATIFTRLIDGRFPKWRDVLPKRTGAVQIELTAGPFFSAVRQAAVVTNQESRGIIVTFREGSLILTSSTAEVGESRVEMLIAYDGPEISVSLDHRFLADFLKVLDPEKSFSIEIEGSDAPALCTTDDGYSYVVMPMAREKKKEAVSSDAASS